MERRVSAPGLAVRLRRLHVQPTVLGLLEGATEFASRGILAGAADRAGTP